MFPEVSAGEEADGVVLMEQAGDAIVAGVDRLAADWVVASVLRIGDAWGAFDDAQRDALRESARVAGAAAAARVGGELRVFFATDPAKQRTTPLEIVRSLRREATEVLRRAGVPGVERDRYEIRSFPDDDYGLVPHSLSDLGDDGLGPMLMVWGVGKSKAIRARQSHPLPTSGDNETPA
jgi:hypothetical protein